MSVFDWCRTDNHRECTPNYQRFIIVPNRKRGEPPTKVEYLDEWVYCECRKRGCPCYNENKDRTNKPVRRRKRNS